MSEVKLLLDALLWDIYGKQQLNSVSDGHTSRHRHKKRHKRTHRVSKMPTSVLGISRDPTYLQKLSVRKLVDISAILKLELRLMGYFLERVLISRDRNRRHQEILCGFVDAVLQVECHDAHPTMRFSLSPPLPKATSAATSPTMQHKSNSNGSQTSAKSDDEPAETADDATSDYKQWLHAMKLVARLPGGMPPEFRRKLWLSLADKYLKSKDVLWEEEEEKCFCEKWREDDEELGIQIVKDLHRTGSNLCTGPAGNINQAKLKRILLGYARYNPEVGYCQGFNMLGALILQVMDKEESESMKVMVYLVEGVLPPGYFCGSMGGLQADMGVFRELMTSKLPRLAKHLQKLQGPIENAYEPPLTNVFTMQWFLTMFCTCLPMTCVLRVWDLVLIEGSDVLLRTALVLWSLLEERILITRTADDFYCKMGSFSSELLNGHLVDSNGLIEKVVQLGPIPDIQRLRDKHLYNIAPLRHKQGLQFYFDDEEPESDEESRLAVATVWGIPWGRRGSGSQTANSKALPSENKDRIALDISLLKKQYDRLRERQKQAHIILTTACSTAARQGTSNLNPTTIPVNQLLMGRPAIVTNKGRRIGPPLGAIPPSRKPSLPNVLHKSVKPPEKQLRRGETLHWRDTEISMRRRDSLTWKEIKADRSASAIPGSSEDLQTHKLRNRVGKSDSSSYSEESDGDSSSTDTSLCDEDDPNYTGEKPLRSSSVEKTPKKRTKTSRKQKELSTKLKKTEDRNTGSESGERKRPKSWAPTNDEIPFMLMTRGSPEPNGHEGKSINRRLYEELAMKEDEDSATESDRVAYKLADDLDWADTRYSRIAGDLATTKLGTLHIQADIIELPVTTSAGQLSPMPDINEYLNQPTLSHIPATKPQFLDSTNSLGSGDGEGAKNFDVNDEGVTNEYFERVNSVERPTNLNLFYSLSDEDSIRNAYNENEEEPEKIKMVLKPEVEIETKIEKRPTIEGCEATEVDRELKNDTCTTTKAHQTRRKELKDSFEESLATRIAETRELSSRFSKPVKSNVLITSHDEKDIRNGSINNDFLDFRNELENPLHRKYSLNETRSNRRDPRRLTIARSFTIDTTGKYDAPEIDRGEQIDRRDVKSLETYKPKNVVGADDHVNNKSNKKKVIPSTADLEDRFNRLEKQLSESKKSTENAKSASEEDRGSQSAKSLKSAIDIDSSATELDDRYNTLEPESCESLQAAENTNETEDENNEKEITHNDDYQAFEEGEIKSRTLNKSPTTTNQNKESKEDEVDLETPIRSLKADSNQTRSIEISEQNTKSEDVNQSPTENKIFSPKRNVSSAEIESPIEVTNSDLLDNSENNTVISHDFEKHEKSITDEIHTFIPTTSDLEDRFKALERQMSSQGTSPKTIVAENKKSGEVEGRETSDRKEKETPQKEEKTFSTNSKSRTEIKNPTTVAQTSAGQMATNSKQNLKKIPSIAELEDRFNALQRSQTVSKHTSPKNKKAPPDKIEKTTQKAITKQEDKKSRPENIENRAQDMVASEEMSKASSKTKSPPSTEELEKRFEALENRLSSENITHNKQVADIVDSEEKPKHGSNNQSNGKNLEEENISKPVQRGFNNEEPRMITQKDSRDMISKNQLCVNKEYKKISKESEKQTTETRRASEPPTTNDLENRYEALQRRMSAKPAAQDENQKKKKMMIERTETVEEALERIEKDVLEENVDANESQAEKPSAKSEATKAFSEAPTESATLEGSKETPKRRASEPPTTEELEKRYENLKKRMSVKSDINVSTPESHEIKFEEKQLLKNQSKITENKACDMDVKHSEPSRQYQDTNSESTSGKQQHEHQQTSSNKLQAASPQNPDDPIIPVPPPMQSKQPPATINSSQDNQRRALVEELQSKMTPHDENLKPSVVNPNRKTSNHRTKVADDTSETHAITASRRLKKDEPSWYTQHQHMVRRFSDLPSRADLENRVYFLEQQLSLKHIKQRSASDSEVSSKARLMGSRSTDHGPSTSSNTGHGSDLENRVKAIEKQLSENIIKLSEAMRRKSKDISDHFIDNTSPRKPNAEASEPDSRPGMELVRYSHYDEIEETETTKPINISINIKMRLNKEDEVKQKKHTSAPTSEEFEKRLEALEEQLLKSVPLPVKSVSEEEFRPGGEIKTEEVEELKETVGEDAIQIVEEEQEVQIGRDALSQSSKMIISEKTPSKTQDDKGGGDDKKCTDDIKLKVSRDKDTLGKEKNAAAKQNQSEKDINSIEIQKEKGQEKPEVELQTMPDENKKVRSETVAEVKSEELQSNSDVDVVQNGAENKPVDEPDSQATGEGSVEEKSTKQIPTTSAQDEVQKKIQPDNSNMVLLLDKEPKAVKVRRLTRANTEELEGLLQALEKQLHDRNLIKSNDGKLVRAGSVQKDAEVKFSEDFESISDLSKEIQEFTMSDKDKSTEKTEKSVEKEEKLTGEKDKSVDKKGKSSEKEEDYDWGPDPVKRHLKRSTVYLPSTKELVARYRSLERQIRLLEDVESIDVEHRLNEIERKIKLQYSLSHEKDLFKFLDLCEGKLPDDEPAVFSSKTKSNETSSLHTSPSRSHSKDKTPYTSPARSRERTPYTSPSRSTTRSPYTSPARQRDDSSIDGLPTTEDLEYRYRVLDLVRSKSKDSLNEKYKQKSALKKQPIHPLEMLLDPSPVESDVPTTGELEHRMRVLNEIRTTPSPPSRKPIHRSPTIEDIKRVKMIEDRRPKTPIHDLETLVASPTKKDLPTEDELEARMRALEEEQKFDFKMQKNYKEFNQKLRDVISPSLSFEEFKAAKSREQSPKRPLTPKSAIKDREADYKRDESVIRSTSPKTIRFREDDHRPRSSASIHDIGKMVGTSDGVLKIIEDNSKMLHRILKKTLADSSSSSLSDTTAVAEGLEVLGPRLMRETSPLRRTGTHTGVPLRTEDNINDRLNSIKNTIKSIDSLCEEKPYRREKCQRYIDSLFNDSVYFTSASKKSSLEDLAYKRRSGEYAPSIHVSDHSPRPSSDHYLSRSVGSAEFIRSTSPSPLHHRSTRDLRRDVSPRRRYGDEEREECESRVRTRVNLLPNYYLENSSELLSRSSLNKFQKVDKELDTYKFDDKTRCSSRSVSRSPLRSPYGLREETTTLTTNRNNTTLNNSHTATTTTPISRRLDLDRPVSPYHQTSHKLIGHDSSLPNSSTPYSPAKLEIRHTTVTSTFYDRVLTKKQIEKSLSRPSSSSPVVSPSVAPKSYLDITPGSSLMNQKSSGNSPTTPVRSAIGAAGSGLVGSANIFQTRASSDSSSITASTSPSLLSNAAATTPTGNSSALPNSYRFTRLPPVIDNNSTELGMHSSDNILMQLKSSPSAGAGTVLQSNSESFTTTTTTTTPANIYTSFLNTNPIDSSKASVRLDTPAPTTTTASTSHLSSAGVYNPLLPLNLRPVPDIGMQFNHLQTANTSSINPINYSINLPKS